jgi:hypothetical protein
VIVAVDLDTFVVVLLQFGAAVVACITVAVAGGIAAVAAGELCRNTAAAAAVVVVDAVVVVGEPAAAVHDSIGPEKARPERQNSIVASLVATTTIEESDWGPEPNRPENSNLSLVETLLTYMDLKGKTRFKCGADLYGAVGIGHTFRRTPKNDNKSLAGVGNKKEAGNKKPKDRKH